MIYNLRIHVNKEYNVPVSMYTESQPNGYFNLATSDALALIIPEDAGELTL